MCIAIKNTRNTISKKTLRNCWNNNDMGAGILYINQAGHLSDFKELVSFDNFYKAYQYIRSITKHPVILHFRIATHGKINKENCHPFYVSEKLGFVHNGIISIDTPYKEYSDTWHFNELLKRLPENFLSNEAIMLLIEEFISWSKLIFMDNKGKVTIVNEKDGQMHKGDWYSNGTYKETNYYNVGGKIVYKEDKQCLLPGYYSEDFYEDETEDQKLMREWEEDYERKLRRDLDEDKFAYDLFE